MSALPPQEGLAPGRRSAIVLVLGALVAIGPLTADLYLPSLPSLVHVFATDVATVQLTLSLYLVAFAGAQLFYGSLSDRFGRRPMILAGLAIYLVATLACAAAPSIDTLIAARFVQAFGACCGPVLGRAVVRDLWGGDQAARVLAYLSTAVALAPAAAPILGGLLEEWFGWRAGFVVLAGLGALVVAAVLLALPETNRQRDPSALDPRRMLANYRQLLGDRHYRAHVLAASAIYGGVFGFISGSAHVLIVGVGLSPSWYGVAFGVTMLGYMVGTTITGRTVGRVGVPRLIRCGGLIALAAGLIMTGAALAGRLDTLAVVGPVTLYFFATGFILPTAMAGAIGPYPRMAGLASALLGFIQMTFSASIGLAIGIAHDGTALPMALAFLVLSLVVVLAGPRVPSGGSGRT
jgi:DHA1 family bicyclomycin/chloramphenicol resistance-like MFS transporter